MHSSKKLTGNADGSDDEAWDPIEDMEDDQRHRYIDLIKYFLWMELDDLSYGKNATADASSSISAEKSVPAEEEPKAPAKKLKNKKKNKAKDNAISSSAPGQDDEASTG
ncbi:mfs allantoate protein [Fusarium austroafricanum]|uniref:Mfs allantoate protein n=1 Tax=Fusarium austroafricanum TaxID=2364996 RepID=A0A8H4KL68_9HYPO|nr:mfs allantoate protein [Fusarium austroafricanum]